MGFLSVLAGAKAAGAKNPLGVALGSFGGPLGIAMATKDSGPKGPVGSAPIAPQGAPSYTGQGTKTLLGQ